MTQKRNRKELSDQLKEKWRKHAEQNHYPFVVFIMTCVVCGQSKERTPEFYYIDNGLPQLFRRPCGKEGLCNSLRHPCIDCYNKMKRENCKSKDGFMTLVLKTIKQRHEKYVKEKKVADGIFNVDINTIHQLLSSQNGRCAKTGIVMTLGCFKDFSMSVDRIDNSIGYIKNNIQLVCREANVQGSDRTCGQTSQEDYINVYRNLINFLCHDTLAPSNKEAFEKNLRQTPRQNGVTADSKTNNSLYYQQSSDLHLLHILKQKRAHACAQDRLAKRAGAKMTLEMQLAILRKHDFRCYYSKIPLELSIQSKYRFSFERLDTTKSHGEPGYCVPVVRFLNCIDLSGGKRAKDNIGEKGKGFSTSKLIRMILETNLIQITDSERATLEAYLWFLELESN